MITYYKFLAESFNDGLNHHNLSLNVDSLFDDRALSDVKNINNTWKHRDRFLYMPIDTFLNLSSKLNKQDELKTKNISDLINNKIKLSDIPFLQIDHFKDTDKYARVIGHEGRHRAIFAKSKGFTHLPVLLKTNNIRWSEQDNPNKFDYRENWPEKLISENGDYSIDFPIKRG